MQRALIEVRGVSLRLGAFAVRDADLDVLEGEYFVLLGPTGAGKTVLLECIAGLHRPETGAIHVDGVRVDNVAPEVRGLVIEVDACSAAAARAVADLGGSVSVPATEETSAGDGDADPGTAESA